MTHPTHPRPWRVVQAAASGRPCPIHVNDATGSYVCSTIDVQSAEAIVALANRGVSDGEQRTAEWFSPEEVERRVSNIVERVRADRNPDPGHVRLPDGRDVRVLGGELLLTNDGFAVGILKRGERVGLHFKITHRRRIRQVESDRQRRDIALPDARQG